MIEGKVKNGGSGHKTELWFSLKQFPGVAFEGGFRCGDYQSSPALLTVGSFKGPLFLPHLAAS